MSLRTEFSLSFLSFAQFSFFFCSILLSAFLRIKKRPRVVTDYPGKWVKVALMECKSRRENVPLVKTSFFYFPAGDGTTHLPRLFPQI